MIKQQIDGCFLNLFLFSITTPCYRSSLSTELKPALSYFISMTCYCYNAVQQHSGCTWVINKGILWLHKDVYLVQILWIIGGIWTQWIAWWQSQICCFSRIFALHFLLWHSTILLLFHLKGESLVKDGEVYKWPGTLEWTESHHVPTLSHLHPLTLHSARSSDKDFVLSTTHWIWTRSEPVIGLCSSGQTISFYVSDTQVTLEKHPGNLTWKTLWKSCVLLWNKLVFLPIVLLPHE